MYGTIVLAIVKGIDDNGLELMLDLDSWPARC